MINCNNHNYKRRCDDDNYSTCISSSSNISYTLQTVFYPKTDCNKLIKFKHYTRILNPLTQRPLYIFSLCVEGILLRR